MSSIIQMEVPCESPFDAAPDGCCADGRRCDDICIAIAAAQECKESDHTEADSKGCRDQCCQSQASLISSDFLEPSSCNTALASESAPACKGNGDRGKKQSSSCCTNEQVGRRVNTEITGCPSVDNGLKPITCGTTAEVDSVARKSIAYCTAIKETDKPTNASSCCSTSRKEAISCTPPLRGPSIGQTCCASKITGKDAAHQREASLNDDCCKTENANAQMSDDKRKGKITVDSCSTSTLSKNSSSSTAYVESCSVHLAAAMDRYKALLEAGICICRNVLRQADTCCDKDLREAVSRKRRDCSTAEIPAGDAGPGRSGKGNPIVAEDDCCSTSISIPKNLGTQTVSRKGQRSNQQRGCCGDKPARAATCTPSSPTARSTDEPTRESEVEPNVQDVENDAAKEHVVFNITGMTCTGCVKKAKGVLDGISGITNVNVNFVAGTANLDLDAMTTSADYILRRLEKETGFKCSRLISDYQTLDILLSREAAQAFMTETPSGIVSMEKAGKHGYRFLYDPELIGARTVLSRSGGDLAPPSKVAAANEGKRRMMRMLWSFSASAVLTVPVCVLAFGNTSVASLTKGIIELALATFVQAISIADFYIPALKALIFSKSIEMDMLVVISITAAYGYSIVAFGLETSGVTLEQGSLFETSTLLITLILLGRLVASYAKVRAVQAVSIKSLQAETALLENANGDISEIDARLLEFGDVVRVTNHSKIVSDGQVIGGESAVDESMLTGESFPVSKTIGDEVTAGTLNGSGVLRIRVTRLPGKNSITDIAELVRDALNSKPKIQDLADVVAGYFVPVVVGISIVVFVIWLAVALRIRSEGAGGAIGTAITYSIAVLAISCPCALGLAVPLVLVISGGVAARGGVIIKQAAATERGFKTTDVVFDKTGTLTTGQLEVVEQIFHGNTVPEDQVLSAIYSLVSNDAHPIAQAVATSIRSQGVPLEVVEGVKSVPGCGVQGTWQGHSVSAGNPYWLGLSNVPSIEVLQEDGQSLLCVTVDQNLTATFGLRATVRPEARIVVDSLLERGLKCHIVSGDQPKAVRSVAMALGIDAQNTVSRQSPADKQTYIQNLISMGKTTMFVGDGTNDAVAIAAADIGVQIGAASDVSRATADIVLLGGLDGILTFLTVSKQSYHRIVFNFAWSAVYNVFAILLASGAFVKVRIAPNYAGLGEIVSVLPVVFAALTMLRVGSKSLS